jgi:hypothetical protein
MTWAPESSRVAPSQAEATQEVDLVIAGFLSEQRVVALTVKYKRIA